MLCWSTPNVLHHIYLTCFGVCSPKVFSLVFKAHMHHWKKCKPHVWHSFTLCLFFYKKKKNVNWGSIAFGHFNKYNFQVVFLSMELLQKKMSLNNRRSWLKPKLSKWYFSGFQTWLKPLSQSSEPQSPRCICCLHLSGVKTEGTDLLFVFAALKSNAFKERILYLEFGQTEFWLVQTRGRHSNHTLPAGDTGGRKNPVNGKKINESNKEYYSESVVGGWVIQSL